jgi:hypothetical protein
MSFIFPKPIRGISRVPRHLIVALVVLTAVLPVFAQQSENDKEVWKRETSYWEYVKAVDLDGYRSLWHPDFVGWPKFSAEPARKDHITDWIAAYSEKGTRLKWYSIQPAASQSTENIVVVHYWITQLWLDKAGQGQLETDRITHTWIKTPGGWQIIGGMSAAIRAE